MASGDRTIKVVWDDGSVETFLCPAAYAETWVDGDIRVKFKGRKTSGTAETADTDQAITVANTRRISSSVEA